MTEGRCTDCGADSVITCTCKRFTHSDVLREKALAHTALIADNEKLAARLYSAVLLLGPQNNTCGMYQEAAKKWEAMEKKNAELRNALSDALEYAHHAFALKRFNHVCGDPNSLCDSDCAHDARVSAFLDRARALLKEKS